MNAVMDGQIFKVRLSKTRIYNPEGNAQRTRTRHDIGYAGEGIVLLGAPMLSQRHCICMAALESQGESEKDP